MPRLILTIDFRELEALVKLALVELRNPRDQARYIIRKELCRLGLLKEEDENLSISIEQTTRGQDH